MTRRLLFIVNVDWAFLTNRLPIAREALLQGYQVHIATSLTDKNEVLREYGFIVHSLSMDRGSASISDALRVSFQIYKIYQQIKPDVIHLVTIKPVLLGGLMARFLGMPAVVAAIPGLGFIFMATGFKAGLRRYFVELLYRSVFSHRNLTVIFQNADDLIRLSKSTGLSASKVVLIRGSGVDLFEYPKAPQISSTPVVMLVARLIKDKGIVEFVDAVRLLRQKNLNARFVLVGNVDMANPTSIKDVDIKNWVNEGLIEWWGHRSDMPNVLLAAQVVVLPSYREGLPKVLIEAAASGRAVITTDVPGCRDAIDPNVSGLLVPVRDPSALAIAIESLINDPQRCQAMGDAGRILAERAFDVRQVVDAHMQIYGNLIKNHELSVKKI